MEEEREDEDITVHVYLVYQELGFLRVHCIALTRPNH